MKTKKIKNLEIKMENNREELFFQLMEEYVRHLEEEVEKKQNIRGVQFMMERIHHLMVALGMVEIMTEVNSVDEIEKGGEIFLLEAKEFILE